MNISIMCVFVIITIIITMLIINIIIDYSESFAKVLRKVCDGKHVRKFCESFAITLYVIAKVLRRLAGPESDAVDLKTIGGNQIGNLSGRPMETVAILHAYSYCSPFSGHSSGPEGCFSPSPKGGSEKGDPTNKSFKHHF